MSPSSGSRQRQRKAAAAGLGLQLATAVVACRLAYKIAKAAGMFLLLRLIHSIMELST